MGVKARTIAFLIAFSATPLLANNPPGPQMVLSLVFILPVMAIRTPPLAEADPASPTFRARQLYELSSYTRFVNMLGFPAVSIPVGFDNRGLPVALQMVGRADSDFALIALAVRVQEKTEWHGRVPTAIGDLIESSEGLLG